MAELFDGIREITFKTVSLRLLLAALCGGIIGLDREYRHQPAGLRTHMLICLGSSITVLTGIYLAVILQYHTDIGRIGAQVIAGIGFIGTGSIIKARERVRGLTTAAGLWTCAVVGLCFGGGFYEAGFLATALIFIIEALLARIDGYISKASPEAFFYIEYRSKGCFEEIVKVLNAKGLEILDSEIVRVKGTEKHNACAIMQVRGNRGYPVQMIRQEIIVINGVISCEIM